MKDVILCGDVLERLKELSDGSVQTVITSPPYWGLRDYGQPGQIGLEPTVAEYVADLVSVFREVKRVLKDDGTLWLNLGDSYSNHKDCKSTPQSFAIGTKKEQAHVIEKGKSVTRDSRKLKAQGLKDKDLVGVPWRVAFALQSDGWYLRSDIIWAKPNPMPESVRDRPTRSHEFIFLFSKQKQYYYDADAIKEDAIWAQERRAGLGRLHYRGKRQGADGQGQESFVSIVEKKNKRDVWTVTVKPFKEAHFAVYPMELIRPCVLAGCPVGGTVLDVFLGSGTTAVVAREEGRHFIGIELNPAYVQIAEKRLQGVQQKLNVTNSTEVLEAEALRTPPTPESAGIHAGDLL